MVKNAIEDIWLHAFLQLHKSAFLDLVISTNFILSLAFSFLPELMCCSQVAGSCRIACDKVNNLRVVIKS